MGGALMKGTGNREGQGSETGEQGHDLWTGVGEGTRAWVWRGKVEPLHEKPVCFAKEFEFSNMNKMLELQDR